MSSKYDFALAIKDVATTQIFMCPCCEAPCVAEELSQCSECEEYFCGRASTKCKSICSCDGPPKCDHRPGDECYVCQDWSIVGDA